MDVSATSGTISSSLGSGFAAGSSSSWGSEYTSITAIRLNGVIIPHGPNLLRYI